MNAPRILQLLPALGDGGVERGTVEMANYLSQRGIENFIVSTGGPLVEALKGDKSQHITMPVGSKSPLKIISNAKRLAHLIDSEAIDIVHARSRAPAWAGYLACRFARRDVHFLTTFHGVYSHQNKWKRRYNQVMLKGPLVVANSAFIRNHIISVYGYPAERIIVASRGVDPEQFNPALLSPEETGRVRQELGGQPDAPLIVIVGRITDWKGHRYLVEALDLCARRDLRLAIVGSGVESVIENIREMIRERGLDHRVCMAGSRRDIPAVMAAADLVISSSVRPEAFGRVAIEAQAMATPIIATAHGGSLETVIDGQTGYLVPPADASAMAAAIENALADPAALAEMGQAGRRNVLEKFTIETMLNNEFSAYQRIMPEAQF